VRHDPANEVRTRRGVDGLRKAQRGPH
jgi:hypothetical protein